MKSRPNHRKRECEIGLHYRMGKNYVFGTFFAAVWLFQQVTSGKLNGIDKIIRHKEYRLLLANGKKSSTIVGYCVF